MGSRRWLWIAFGALCTLAAGIGYLARPEDELAEVMRLHPQVTRTSFRDVGPQTEYRFVGVPPKAVLGAVEHILGVPAPVPLRTTPIPKLGGSTAIVEGEPEIQITFLLKDGRPAFFTYSADPSDNVTELDISDRPWYVRAWSTIKCRLGMR